MIDIYSSSVVDLLNLDGVASSTVITDSSYSVRSHSVVGAAALSTSLPKFGTASLYLPSVGSYVTTPGTASFVFGTGDFTLEGWVKSSTPGKCIFDFFGGTGWQLITTASGFLQWYTTAVVKTGAISVTDGAWHHVAVTRVAGMIYLFVDGVADGAGVANTTNHASTQTFFAVGAQASARNSAYDWIGYIDDVRITKGIGRYSASFTAPTTAYAVDPPNSASLVAPSAGVVSWGGGVAALKAPSPRGYSGLVVSGNIALLAPAATLRVDAGLIVSLIAPSAVIGAAGHNSANEQAANLTAPKAGLVAYSGASSSLVIQRQTLVAAGTVTNRAAATLTAPKPELAAIGTVSAMASANLAITTAYRLVGYGGAVCRVNVIGKSSLLATGSTGSVGVATLTCPLFELVATATAQNRGAANLVAPSPRMGQAAQAWLMAPGSILVAIGTATVTASYEAYAVNLNHSGDNPIDEMTRYTNFPFTHIVRYQGSYFGVAADGLYLLEGTTDHAVPTAKAIPWKLETHLTDFGSPLQKTPVSAYVGGRLGRAETFTLLAGEKKEQAYRYTNPRGETAQNYRQKMGRGIKARYFAVSLEGDGAAEIDNLEFEVNTMTRRI